MYMKQFFYPISGQGFTEAEKKIGSKKYLNLFQLDTDDNSWFEITLQIAMSEICTH